jgi:hypothetical protein
MSNSKKVKSYFLDDNKSNGKKNVKDINRGRKFNWRVNINESENDENDRDDNRYNKSY